MSYLPNIDKLTVYVRKVGEANLDELSCPTLVDSVRITNDMLMESTMSSSKLKVIYYSKIRYQNLKLYESKSRFRRYGCYETAPRHLIPPHPLTSRAPTSSFGQTA